MDFPEPVIGIAVEPKTQKDMDKLSNGLAKLAEEDPTFTVKTDEQTEMCIRDRLKSWMPSMNKVVHTSVKNICIEWLKLTVHLLILDSNTIKIQSIKNLK